MIQDARLIMMLNRLITSMLGSTFSLRFGKAKIANADDRTKSVLVPLGPRLRLRSLLALLLPAAAQPPFLPLPTWAVSHANCHSRVRSIE